MGYLCGIGCCVGCLNAGDHAVEVGQHLPDHLGDPGVTGRFGGLDQGEGAAAVFQHTTRQHHRTSRQTGDTTMPPTGSTPIKINSTSRPRSHNRIGGSRLSTGAACQNAAGAR